MLRTTFKEVISVYFRILPQDAPKTTLGHSATYFRGPGGVSLHPMMAPCAYGTSAFVEDDDHLDEWHATYHCHEWRCPIHSQLERSAVAPEVELGSIRQSTSGEVSLWEFWLLESGVLEGKSQMQGRRLDCLFQACILTFPPFLELHVHIERLWGREAGYHRTEAMCQHGTMEACTQHQSSKFPQCAGHHIRKKVWVKAEVKTSHQCRAGSSIARCEPFHTGPPVFLWHV